MALMCVNGGAYMSAANVQSSSMTKAMQIDAGIQVALMLWQRKVRKRIMKDQTDIAERQVNLAEEINDHQEQFWPAEKGFLSEFFSESKHKEDYISLPNQWRKISRDTLAEGRSDWIREMERRCLKPTRCEDARWLREDRRSQTDVMTFADRHAEARANALNDNRYSKQYSALALSKGLLNEIMGYTAAMGVARTEANNILANTVTSVAEAVGYTSERLSQSRTGMSRWGAGQPQHFYIGHSRTANER